MIKKEITLFSFNELTEDVRAELIKERAVKLQEDYSNWWLSDDMEMECNYFLTGEGSCALPKEFNICYSLSYCQGDGVSFQGRLFKHDAPEIEFANAEYIVINNIGNYTHSHSFSIEAYDEDGNYIENNGYLYEQFRNISKELEKIGYGLMERDFLDEAEEDLFNQDDVVYLSNGKVWTETV